MRTLAGAGAAWFLAAALAGGQEVEVTALRSNGGILWTAPSGTVCAIEWRSAMSPTAAWQRTWNTAQGIRMTHSQGGAEVPAFYRVVCETNPISLITPYVAPADMHWVRQAYSSTTNCPWGFEHDGIDFEPAGDAAPFRAVCAGTITDVVLRHAPDPEGTGGNWDVYVELQCDATWAVGYNFEPKSTDLADGVAQLTNIVVSLLQGVTNGQAIGRLHRASDSAHVHLSLWRNGYMYHSGVNASPEPFFTPEARASVLALLRARYPGAKLTY